MTRSETALLVDIEPIVQHRGTVSSCEIELCNMLDEKKKKRKEPWTWNPNSIQGWINYTLYLSFVSFNTWTWNPNSIGDKWQVKAS